MRLVGVRARARARLRAGVRAMVRVGVRVKGRSGTSTGLQPSTRLFLSSASVMAGHSLAAG